MKRYLSKWSKEAKIAMIQKDLTTNDIANKFHWTNRYVSSLVNGRSYTKEGVERISYFLGIDLPEGSTLARVEAEIETS